MFVILSSKLILVLYSLNTVSRILITRGKSQGKNIENIESSKRSIESIKSRIQEQVKGLILRFKVKEPNLLLSFHSNSSETNFCDAAINVNTCSILFEYNVKDPDHLNQITRYRY